MAAYSDEVEPILFILQSVSVLSLIHIFMPADRGVNHRVADFVASKPQLNAPAYWSLIGHDKRHCRPDVYKRQGAFR